LLYLIRTKIYYCKNIKNLKIKKSKNKRKGNEGAFIDPCLILQIEIDRLVAKLNEIIHALNIAFKDTPHDTTRYSTCVITLSKTLETYRGSSGTLYGITINEPRHPGGNYIYRITITKTIVRFSEITPICYKTAITHSTTLMVYYNNSEECNRLSLFILSLMEQLKEKSASLSALSDSK